MSAWVELRVKGNIRAFIDASHVKAIFTAPDATGDQPATPEAPMTLAMASGETLEGVYGLSPNRLIVYLAGARALLRQSGRQVVVAYLDEIEAFEAQIGHVLTGGIGDGETG